MSNKIIQQNKTINNQTQQIQKSNNEIENYKIVQQNQQIQIKQAKTELDILSTKLSSITTELKQAKDANKHLKYLGKFKITYYDLSYKSCGKYPSDPAYGITYSGNHTVEGITCAVDTSLIPLGSYLYINNTGCRVAQDIGGKIKGNHIDVYVTDFSYDKYSTHYTDVYLIN